MDWWVSSVHIGYSAPGQPPTVVGVSSRLITGTKCINSAVSQRTAVDIAELAKLVISLTVIGAHLHDTSALNVWPKMVKLLAEVHAFPLVLMMVL